jgi:hypothetical protein
MGKMKLFEAKIPNIIKELEKELNEHLSNKCGDRIKLDLSMLVPKPAPEEVVWEKEKKGKRLSKVHFDMKLRMKETDLEGHV